MNSKTIKIGNYYRLKNSIDNGWVKVLEVKKTKENWKNNNNKKKKRKNVI